MLYTIFVETKGRRTAGLRVVDRQRRLSIARGIRDDYAACCAPNQTVHIVGRASDGRITFPVH